MSSAPVRFTPEQRPIVLNALCASLEKWKIQLVVLSVDATHVHLLARFPLHNPRHFIGVAKKESSAFLTRDHGFPSGGLWSRRCECVPIADREQQLSVVRYILRHQQQKAAVRLLTGAAAATPKQSAACRSLELNQGAALTNR
jgi:hypothetical protein